MSSVNPPDTYNGFITKHLVNYEDELKNDYKRAQERSHEDVERLGRAYEESSRKTGERADESVEKIRDTIQDHYERSREEDHAELERIRRQSYDRFGRDRSNEADGYKDRVAQLNHTIADDQEHHEKILSAAEASANRKSDIMDKEYQNKMENAVQTERDSAQASLNQIARHQKSALESQAEESKIKYDRLNDARTADQTESRQRNETLIADGRRDMNNLTRHLNDSIDQRLEKDHQAGIEREEHSAQRAKQSQDLQSQGLREQVRTLLANENQFAKEKGSARAEVIHEFEDEWRGKLDQVSNSDRLEIDALNARAKEMDHRNVESSENKSRERDAYFTGVIAKKNQEAREDLNTTVKRYDTALKEGDQRLKKDQLQSEAHLDNALRSANEGKETALNDQAVAFKQSGQIQKREDDQNIAALQKQVDRRPLVSDEREISPALEASVRRSIIDQYAKNLTAETERNQRGVDLMQRSFSDKYQNMHAEHQMALTASEQRHISEAHQNEAVFIDHIQETELQRDQALRTSSEDHDRQTETVNRVYSQAMTRQRNEYESIVQNIKDDASSRIQTSRQESEFAMKQQHRAFSVHENELIRDYEKKLADQKVDHDASLEEIRNQAQQTVHDADRRGKQNYDDLNRNMEQRIAQLEDQHKERERSITQNFEDQLDKVKRSNALIQSKKG